MPTSAQDDFHQSPLIHGEDGHSRLHAEYPDNSSRKTSSHAWQSLWIPGEHRIVPCLRFHVWDWYQDRCIHSLRHHEPTRVFYPLWFLFRRNVQVAEPIILSLILPTVSLRLVSASFYHAADCSCCNWNVKTSTVDNIIRGTSKNQRSARFTKFQTVFEWL